MVKTSLPIHPLYQSAQSRGDTAVATILPTSGICKDIGSRPVECHVMWGALSCLRNPCQAGTLLVTIAGSAYTMGCPLPAVTRSGPEDTYIPCSRLRGQGVSCDLANTGSGSCKGNMLPQGESWHRGQWLVSSPWR